MKTSIQRCCGVHRRTCISTAPLAVAQVAQDSQSVSAAAALTALLDARKLEAIATRDPDQPGNFVAALYFSGSQLLVISSPSVSTAGPPRQTDSGLVLTGMCTWT